MVVQGETAVQGERPAPAREPRVREIQAYRQLVALQREIVEQARRNAEVEEECGLLWRKLVRRPNRRRSWTGLRRLLRALGRGLLARRGGALDTGRLRSPPTEPQRRDGQPNVITLPSLHD